ncbi:MAG: hypothetical protein WCH34_01260 [Bacteroidota bacterium]
MNNRIKCILTLILITNCCFGQFMDYGPGLAYYDFKYYNPACIQINNKMNFKLVSINEIKNKDSYYLLEYASFEKSLIKLKSNIAITAGYFCDRIISEEVVLYENKNYFGNLFYNYNPLKGFYIGLSASIYSQNDAYEPSFGYFGHVDSLTEREQLIAGKLSIGLLYKIKNFNFGLFGMNILNLFNTDGKGFINNIHPKIIGISSSYKFGSNKLSNIFALNFFIPYSYYSSANRLNIQIKDILLMKNNFEVGLHGNLAGIFSDRTLGLSLSKYFYNNHFLICVGYDRYLGTSTFFMPQTHKSYSIILNYFY